MVYTGGRVRRGTATTVKTTPLLTKLEARHNRYLRKAIIRRKKPFQKHLLLMQHLLYYYGSQLTGHEKELAREKRKIRKEKLDAKRALQHRLLFDEAISLESSSDDSSDEDEMPRFTNMEVEHSISLGIKKSDFGGPEHTCKYCGAILWHQERSKRSAVNPEFSICCSKGNVKLPLLRDAPEYLKRLLDFNGGQMSRKFRNMIRAYNSMLAFTSTGARFDNKHNRRGKGPWTYRIQGQSYYKIGSLVPPRNKDPGYNQLYICDTELAHEALRRKNIFFKQAQQDDVGVDSAQKKTDHESKSSKKNDSELDLDVITNLITMMDQHNPYAKTFRMAKHRMQSEPTVELRLRIISRRQKDARQYNLPTCSEVAALIVQTPTDDDVYRDIIVEHKENGYIRIKEIHPCYMSMQFPILFPRGEDGYNIDTAYRNVKIGKDGVLRKRQQLTMREYYAFRLQKRLGEGQTLINGGRLFQQYCVDAYACIEECRLKWVRKNQEHIRADLHCGLKDSLLKGDSSIKKGKRIVLPSSFTGGPRYMMQHYQDAIAICRRISVPDLFITFTCNPKWKEITLALTPGQRPEDRPDIIARVFKLKLKHLMEVLRTKKHFGTVKGAIYTIEFQKRGLPHAHILLFLEKKDKPETPSDINRIVTAEIPDKEKDPEGYQAVVNGKYFELAARVQKRIRSILAVR